MDRENTENKKSKNKGLLLLAALAVVLVGAAWFVISNTQNQAVEDEEAARLEAGETKIISEIDGAAPAAAAAEEGSEETPRMIRTVDADGRKTWVKAEPVEIWQPGGKSKMARLSATETGRRMSEAPRPPAFKKDDEIHYIHPTEKKQFKGKKKKDKQAESAEPVEEQPEGGETEQGDT